MGSPAKQLRSPDEKENITGKFLEKFKSDFWTELSKENEALGAQMRAGNENMRRAFAAIDNGTYQPQFVQ